ncbi:oxygenase MpaB family protein [Nocardia sp. NPDC056611]|uniref:oxygenase MpaB family protein n=1 Tax=Nocardia sp. NPDC056611 TaxID=3345877 RepID=UPI00366D4404
MRRNPIEPGTWLWDEIGLITFSLTGGAAFLLQTMDPTISAVVDEYSTFRTDAVGRAARSIASVMMWVYGGEEAVVEADRLRQMHAHFTVVDGDGVRRNALAAAPWAWVLQTGVYSMVEASRYFARREFTAAEKDQIWQESKQLLRNFKVVDAEIPDTYGDLVAHVEDVIARRLIATGTARDFLRAASHLPPPPQLPSMLHPLWRVGAAPIGRLQHHVIVGTTPPAARRLLGVRWRPVDELALRVFGKAVAHTVVLLPERLRYFPIAYEARRLERDRQRLRRMIDLRPI